MEIAEKRMQTCCFTGHRQLPSEEQAEIANKLERVIAALLPQIPAFESLFCKGKNNLEICAETTRLGSGQKAGCFGRISCTHAKSTKFTNILQERGCDFMTGVYNIASKQ